MEQSRNIPVHLVLVNEEKCSIEYMNEIAVNENSETPLNNYNEIKISNVQSINEHDFKQNKEDEKQSASKYKIFRHKNKSSTKLVGKQSSKLNKVNDASKSKQKRIYSGKSVNSNSKLNIIKESYSLPYLVYDDRIPIERIELIKLEKTMRSQKSRQTSRPRNDIVKKLDLNEQLKSWLVCCNETKRVYCWPCVLLKNEVNASVWYQRDGVAVSTLFKYKTCTESIKYHCTHTSHIKNVKLYSKIVKLLETHGDVQLRIVTKPNNEEEVEVADDLDIEEVHKFERKYLAHRNANTANRHSIDKLLELNPVSTIVSKERIKIARLGRPTAITPKVTSTWIKVQSDYKKCSNDFYCKFPWLSSCHKRHQFYCWPCLFIGTYKDPIDFENNHKKEINFEHEDSKYHYYSIYLYNQIEDIIKNNLNVSQLRINDGLVVEMEDSSVQELSSDVREDEDMDGSDDVPNLNAELSDVTLQQTKTTIETLLNIPFHQLTVSKVQDRIKMFKRGRPKPAKQTLASLYQNEDWITGCNAKQLFCWKCLLFSWCNSHKGFSNKQLQSHNKTNVHITSCQLYDKVDGLLSQNKISEVQELLHLESRKRKVTHAKFIGKILNLPDFLFLEVISKESYNLVKSVQPTPDLLDDPDTDLYMKYTWLAGCEEVNRFFCWPCVLFAKRYNNKSNLWFKQGLIPDYDLVCEEGTKHDIDPEHVNAVSLCNSFLNQLDDQLIRDEMGTINFIRGDYNYNDFNMHNIQRFLDLGVVTNDKICRKRLEILKLGPPTPPLANPDIRKVPELYYKCLSSPLYNSHSWLSGCSQTNKLYCWPCLAFSSSENFSFNVKCSHVILKEHERSAIHLRCTKLYNYVQQLQADTDIELMELSIVDVEDIIVKQGCQLSEQSVMSSATREDTETNQLTSTKSNSFVEELQADTDLIDLSRVDEGDVKVKQVHNQSTMSSATREGTETSFVEELQADTDLIDLSRVDEEDVKVKQVHNSTMSNVKREDTETNQLTSTKLNSFVEELQADTDLMDLSRVDKGDLKVKQVHNQSTMSNVKREDTEINQLTSTKLNSFVQELQADTDAVLIDLSRVEEDMKVRHVHNQSTMSNVKREDTETNNLRSTTLYSFVQELQANTKTDLIDLRRDDEEDIKVRLHNQSTVSSVTREDTKTNLRKSLLTSNPNIRGTIDKLLQNWSCEPKLAIDCPYPEVLLDILKQGRPTPQLPYKVYKIRDQSGVQYFRMGPSIYKILDWLAGCSTRYCVYCWPCLLFNLVESDWNKDGVIDVLDIMCIAKLHCETLEHQIAYMLYQSVISILKHDWDSSFVIRKMNNEYCVQSSSTSQLGTEEGPVKLCVILSGAVSEQVEPCAPPRTSGGHVELCTQPGTSGGHVEPGTSGGHVEPGTGGVHMEPCAPQRTSERLVKPETGGGHVKPCAPRRTSERLMKLRTQPGTSGVPTELGTGANNKHLGPTILSKQAQTPAVCKTIPSTLQQPPINPTAKFDIKIIHFGNPRLDSEEELSPVDILSNLKRKSEELSMVEVKRLKTFDIRYLANLKQLKEPVILNDISTCQREDSYLEEGEIKDNDFSAFTDRIKSNAEIWLMNVIVSDDKSETKCLILG